MTDRPRPARSRAPRFTGEELRAFLLFAVLAALVVIGATAIATRPAKAETCIASNYGVGDGYGGRRTASGERMNPHAMTAAHRSKPFGSHARVCTGHRCVTVRINDRGPFVRGRCIDLSHGAAEALGIGGTARVRVE